jgi:HAD superfamily hydrolase (TIGR01549 family)
MAYRAVLFDLFDTLVRFDRDRLPLVEIDGKPVRTTAGHLLAVMREYRPLTLEACYVAHVASWQEAERLRAIDHREVAARERFAFFLRRLELDPVAHPDLVERLLRTHGRVLGQAADFPAHHGPLLRALASRARLAIVSNFDYTPTARDILERAGVVGLFDAIVVSDEIGWRKPRAEIFDEAMARIGVGPEAALFVGDRADIDVAGAQAVGLHAAWINPDAVPLPAGMRAPEYEIRDLDELPGILERS